MHYMHHIRLKNFLKTSGQQRMESKIYFCNQQINVMYLVKGELMLDTGLKKRKVKNYRAITQLENAF